MSRFGDLVTGVPTEVTPITTPAPVVQEAPPAPVPDIAPPKPIENAVPLRQQLFKKSKVELEKMGRELGIELDRRLTHSKLVAQVQAAIEKKG